MAADALFAWRRAREPSRTCFGLRQPRPPRWGEFTSITSFWLAALLLVSWALPVAAEVVDPNLWVTPGTVSAIARSGNTLYLAGALGEVGPATGGGVPVDMSNAAAKVPYPKVTGYVSCAVPDGSGGWFIAGDFSAVSGIPRNSLAHILADGSLSPWAPSADDHHMGRIVLSHGCVYVTGSFSTMGGQARNHLAAIDAVTGEVTDWNPHPTGSLLSYVGGPDVLALVVRGDTVYVGGNFTQIGGETRYGLAAIDARTGGAFSWDPGGANSYITVLALWENTLFVGGYFTELGGQSRSLLAAVDVTTGSITSWNPEVTGPQSNYVVGPYVQALLVRNSTVYVGGRFDKVGGQLRSALAAVDGVSGALCSWKPDPIYHYTFPWPYVWALAARGDTIFVGGSFDAIGGRERAYLAAVDGKTGEASDWNPRPNEQVWSLAVSGSLVYVGGSFRTMGAWKTRHGLAALDLTTGALKDWDPDPNGLEVRALAVGNGVVYAGGDFTFVGGQPRSGVAALDTLTGAATAWNPAADGEVRTMQLEGGTLYVGGGFWNIGGQPRHYAAALDTLTGIATNWDPKVEDWVFTMAIGGNVVYLGGLFESLCGTGRKYLAAVDASTGAVLPWQADADRVVDALVVSGETVYAGGAFATIAGQMRNCLASLDISTGALKDWNPNIYGSGVANLTPEVHALAVSGHTVYVGGDFYFIGGQVRSCLAAVDDSVGFATAWAPQSNFPTWALAVSGNTLYAGGSFGSVGLQPTPGLAAISIPVDPVPPTESDALAWNFPNPARVGMTIRIALPTAVPVSLTIFDLQGRRIAKPFDHVLRPPGRQDILIHVDQWKPGVYLYRLDAGGRSATRKFLVVR